MTNTNISTNSGEESALGICGAPHCGGTGRTCVLPPGHGGGEHRTATGLRWPVAGHPAGPAPAGEVEEAGEDEVRAALQAATRWISYAAGRENSADPWSAGRLMAAADEVAGYLARTGATVETGAAR
ncbi:hypothetical protein [Streptomyces otsuchiensis]|uniref:hypothetical protein n=1 Tax=Streptomyces otsuchiensis TaxID=2681388 RepID=UPI00102F3C9D|nr:hypothetical protein [Streptomyces otsuchiensis]